MKTAVKVFLLLMIVALAIGLLIPNPGTNRVSAYHAKVKSDLREICFVVIEQYAASGEFPESLESLPRNMVDEDTRYFYDPDSGRPYNWVYYGNRLQNETPDSATVLIVAPAIFGDGKKVPNDKGEKFKIVGFSDGHVERMTISEFEILIAEQNGGINSGS